MLGEALSTAKPGGGELLGDLKFGESSVARTEAGDEDGGYPILSKILGSAGSFSWAFFAACTAFILAETAGWIGVTGPYGGGYPESKMLWSGDFFAWAAIAAFIAILLAAKAGDRGEETSALAGVELVVEDGVFSKEPGGLFFFFFFLGDLVGSSLSTVVSWSRLG